MKRGSFRHLIYGVAAMAASTAVAVGESADWRSELVSGRSGSVVSVLPQTGRQERNMSEPEGTGVAIGAGDRVLTADHVLGSANDVLIRLADGEVRRAEIVLRDAETDLAILRADPPLPPAMLSQGVRSGDDVCALGSAFGLGISLTCGVVSATDRRGVGFNRIEDFIQTDAAINPGMSGAPLFDREGRLAGLVSAIFTKRSDANLGVNFAVSARLLAAFLDDAADGAIDRGRPALLLRPEPLPGETGRAGGRVVRIAPGSPEADGGVIVGDLLIRAGGLEIRGQPDYLAFLALFTGVEERTLLVVRDGRQVEIVLPGKR